jgi:hypothetical protein
MIYQTLEKFVKRAFYENNEAIVYYTFLRGGRIILSYFTLILFLLLYWLLLNILISSFLILYFISFLLQKYFL